MSAQWTRKSSFLLVLAALGGAPAALAGPGPGGPLPGSVWADFDGDGLKDLFRAGPGGGSLLRNVGDGSFSNLRYASATALGTSSTSHPPWDGPVAFFATPFVRRPLATWTLLYPWHATAHKLYHKKLENQEKLAPSLDLI